MPVRKIPKNHLHVTGSFASRKNGLMGSFESLLEKEYMLLLDFDENVEGFEEQPITIPLPSISKGYTPDILVRFRADMVTGRVRPPLLTEISKFRSLTIIDVYTREALAIEVGSRLTGEHVVATLNRLVLQRGAPASILVGNGRSPNQSTRHNFSSCGNAEIVGKSLFFNELPKPYYLSTSEFVSFTSG